MNAISFVRAKSRVASMRVVANALLAIPACLAPAVATAAPMPMSFFCMANAPQAHTLYLSGIFPAAAGKRDVISAWNLYLESQNIHSGPGGSCDAAVDPAGVKALMDASRASAANLKFRVVDVDWKFTNQVAISDPNKLYGYCTSGASVANATYFSDVFGMSLRDAMQRAKAATPFFQYIRAKYGDPPGLGVGTGPGPHGEWCPMIGNIADAERDKKSSTDKLQNPTRQIIETGWRYGETPTPPAPAAAAAVPAAPAVAASQAITAATAAVASPSATAKQIPQGWSYFCTANSRDHQYTYFTQVHVLDADYQTVSDAWQKYVSLSHTPGIVEAQGSGNCVVGITEGVESRLSNFREHAERNAAYLPSAGLRVVEVDWKYAP